MSEGYDKVRQICEQLREAAPHMEGRFAAGQVVLATIILETLDGKERTVPRLRDELCG